jgi:hypothetical protein
MRVVSLAAAAGLLLAATTVGLAQNPNSGAGDPETRKNESMPGQSGAAPSQQPGQQIQQRGMQGQQQQPGTTGQAPNRQNTPAQSPGGGGGAGAGNPQDPLTNNRR